MKRKVISIIAGILLLISAGAQTIDEALLYSQLFYGGSARFQAMGGAFTSLGSDLSGLTLNPAGMGMFRATEVSFTTQMYINNSESNFNGHTITDNANNFNVNQAGLVFPVIQKEGEGLKGFTIGYSYNRTNNYNANTLIRGTSTSSSMADYWSLRANSDNVTPENLGSSEWLAFLTYVIDTIPGTVGNDYATIFSNYGNAANSTYGQTTRRIITNEGHAGEHAISMAGNFSDKIFLGVTFGISTIRSETRYSHLESDDDNNIPIFEDFTYTNVVYTDGTGYNFKVGIIVRPISVLRVGFAFHAPTVYRLNEYYYDSMIANDIYGRYDEANDPFRFEYTLTTPMRFNTGISLQIGKMGIISGDYEYVDYSTAKFSKASDLYDYFNENDDIKTIFAPSHNFRIGAEMRLNAMFYLRGGYSFYGSGFESDQDNADNNYSVYSGGVGFRQSNIYFDLSYALRHNSQAYFMYGYPTLDPVELTYNRHMITGSIGLRF